ncbi:hypothetical protein MJ257_10300 [Paenibacillus timonensis]|uniref:Protein kinase domain-containing protein n=1 Tax=Paenibacillus timonensis TaxID=225915 RepID=A0ABW3S9I2_9BACL|nr:MULTISPECIES: hypothetical protein [Paenibacillus]MCH1640498.1 hypothetical protein [Paenibacillus timonensis]MDU2241233.1 hypothetical protein [Paenibacillus sp.]
MKKIILYGAGTSTKELISTYKFLSIDFIVDRNQELWGASLNGIPIISPDIISTINIEDFIIIVTAGDYLGPKKFLEEKGLKENINFLPYNHLYNEVYITSEGELKIFDSRRFIPEKFVPNFFDILLERNIRYIILKSKEIFEEMSGDSVHLLVHDDDLYTFNELLDSYETNGARMCFVYSVTGKKGSSYKGSSFFPTVIAEDLLENRLLIGDKYSVNDTYKIFLSLSYHVVYHLTELSNLPIDRSNLIFGIYATDLDYRKVLKRLAKELKLTIKVNLYSLYTYLKAMGWEPSTESFISNSNILKYFSKQEDHSDFRGLIIGGHGNRAKVELFEVNDSFVVRKTFKQGYESYLSREITAYQNFSKEYNIIPPLIESGSNYLTIPWYSNVIRHTDEVNHFIKQKPEIIIQIICFFYNKGYALIDFNPNNLLWTSDGNNILIDFEFLYKYDEKPATIFESYDVVGVPEDFNGDLPKNGRKINFKSVWEPIIGKSFIELYSSIKPDTKVSD